MSKQADRNLNTHQKEFVKALQAMSPNGSRSLRDVFDDFMLVASTAFRQAVNMLTVGRLDEELEKTVLALSRHYPNTNDFGQCLAIMVAAFEEHRYDFLGEVFSSIDATNSYAGQFFTPSPVSELSAKMIMDESHFKAVLKAGRRFSIGEPAVGAGSMAIECVKIVQSWGASKRDYYLDATDVDIRCVRMAYLQLSLLDAPAIVRHGNTLSLEQWVAWPTLAFAMNPHIPKVEKAHSVTTQVTGRRPRSIKY
jgi:type I restriction-modification system DNA methylase subunit